MSDKSTALTEPGIRRIAMAAPGKRIEKFDRLAPGLALRVNDKGRKAWVAHYRVDGRLRKLALGEWPGLGVADAREEMRKVRDAAKAGRDPGRERERKRAAARAQAEAEAQALRTFGTVAEEYIRRETPKLKRGAEIASVIRRELLPAWRDKPITSLRKRDAIRLTDKLVDAGRHGAALKLHEVIRRVFNWALDRDEIDASPFAALKPPIRKEPRQHALTHAELRTLWAVWGDQAYPWGALQRFLLLTGQRRGEAAEMRWSELDDADHPTVWHIPAERSKSKREHVVPLSEPARTLLQDLPRFTRGEFVFTTTGGERPVSGFSKAKARADRLTAAKVEDERLPAVRPWRWHDLRRTVRTELARLGIPEAVAERILNHAGDTLERTYNVYAYRREKAEALERWAWELPAIVGETAAADVVPFSKRR